MTLLKTALGIVFYLPDDSDLYLLLICGKLCGAVNKE